MEYLQVRKCLQELICLIYGVFSTCIIVAFLHSIVMFSL
uniref:Uncharacterized protein n=1 Tax=Manihot esculenta TaxID=3983 RepID=A0A2C9WD26_MANES